MRYIPHSPEDEIVIYDRLSASQGSDIATRLTTARPLVWRDYGSYMSASDVTTLTPDSALERWSNELQENYTSLRYGRYKDIGLKVLKRSRTCCMCGHRDASQLDHYLPKALFPEFSALTANLVPVCHICNPKKSSTYLRQGGLPAFLHPYRDPLPDEQFLQAEIELDDDGVTAYFRVTMTTEMDPSVFDTLQYQFERLKIGQLYGEQAASILNEKRTALYDYYGDDGAESVQRYLDREARTARAFFGSNHWQPVLLKALSNDHNFCNEGFMVLGPPDEWD